jgi:hypothetical protein
MNCVLQRSWHLQVERIGESLISSCHYLDSFEEKKVVLKAGINDYCIQEAELIKLGCPRSYTESTLYLNELKGVPAYAGSGSKLREVLEPIVSDQDRELINQCIIGAFQAETFIYQERGFVSAQQYSQAGDEFLQGTCSYYSNLDRVKYSWADYIGDPQRKKYLFNRFKSQHLIAAEDKYWLCGSLNDTFHQVNTFLQLAKADGRVKVARGELLKAPDQVCRESSDYVQDLIGINILQMSKKELAYQLGAQKGCVHLIDIIFDSAETLRMYVRNSGQD